MGSCSIPGSTKKAAKSCFFRIFAEFSGKFSLKVHEEPYGVGVRFFFCTTAKVFRRFQVARDSFSLLKPRKLRSRLSKFRIFALIVFVSFPEIQSIRHSPRISSLFLSIFCLRRVRIEVELFAQNRPPLSL